MARRKKTNDPLLKYWYKLPGYVRNRYFVTLVLFTAFMVFVDRHDVMTQLNLYTTVNRLENDLERYEERTDEARAERLEMENNRETFARENYFMQKDDEDVFIIVEE